MSNHVVLHTLRIDTVLEGALYKYKIKNVLGQGSFGITYLAIVQMKGSLGTIESNMMVAIKEFYMRDINGREGDIVTSGNKGGLFDEYKKKFEREATNLSKLEHPNIVKVLESFEANGTIYYVMEYIDGVSLDKKIEEKKRLDYKTCIKYTKQIGSAIAFMHKEHMLHLDVKPANIMLRKSDDAVLIDFGLSKQYDENGEPESSTKVGGGTPGYAPLEQANYHEGKDFPVIMDVYALGGTMFKMLSGCRPPEASDILNDGFPEKDLIAVNVPRQLIGCLEKAMNPTKKNRYQTIVSFIDAIEFALKETDESEDTSVEIISDDDLTAEEIEIVDVQRVDSKKYQVLITNNGKTLSSVRLSDKIFNLIPEESEIDINKDFTYQQVLSGEAGSNIVANLRDDCIEITYRFGVEEKTIKFVFKEENKEIPFTSIMPVLEFNGTSINIPSETYTFRGKEIYGLKRIKCFGTDYRVKRENEELDLRRLQDICIIQVEHCFLINFSFKQPEDKPKYILFSSSHGQFPFTDVTNHLEAVLPGYQEDYSYAIESPYYERETGHFTPSGTQIQLPLLRPMSKKIATGQQGESKLTDVHVNTKKRNKKRVRYYYGIGAAVLLVIVSLYWGQGKFSPTNSGDTTDSLTQVEQQQTTTTTTASSFQTITANGVSFKMIRVDGASSGTFYIGETEVTQALWQAVMGSNPSNFKGKDRPVENVCWGDCKTFIGKLNTMTRKNFRLPTEAEWEYAAKGGNMSSGYEYSGSNKLDEVGWYYENSGNSRLDDSSWDFDKSKSNGGCTHIVKQKKPNELGLYDMSGNVWEWCEDLYSSSGSSRVRRGGGWGLNAEGCSVSNRSGGTPGFHGSNLGLRLAL